MDANGNTILFGVRSGNNCFMSKPSNMCLSSMESQLDLWHKRLGHMNVHGMTRIVKAEVIEEFHIWRMRHTMCEACNKRK